MIEIERTNKEDSPHGLLGVLGYDEDCGNFSPRTWGGNLWTLISNKASRHLEIDATISTDALYSDEELTRYVRERWDAHLIVPVRYESHGPQGRYVPEDLIKPGELFEGSWSFEALAVVSKAQLKEAGIRRHKKALAELKTELDAYSDWANGHVYEVLIVDRYNEILDSVADIYGFDDARAQMNSQLSYWEQRAVKEDEQVAYWAARDVVTLAPACRQVAAGW